MKKRNYLFLLSVIPFLLAGCGEHTHTFSSEWSKDEAKHWHAATCEHTDLKADEGEHTFVNDVCSICNYKKQQQKTDLFGLKVNYTGEFSDITYVDCTAEEFEDAMKNIYINGLPQLRQAIADALYTYHDPSKGVEPKTPDSKLWFGDESTAQERTLESGDKITTYKVNNVDDKMLCEYALDPEITDKNVYHFYITDQDVTYIYPFIETHTYGNPTSVTIYDEGITINNGVITIKVDVTFVLEQRYPYEAKFSLNFSDGTAPKSVNITKQPEDVTIRYPEGFKMEVEVDHPEEVISYQWLAGSVAGSGVPHSFSPIYGENATKRVLEINTSGEETSQVPYKCLITTANSEIYSDVAFVNISNTHEYIPVAYVMDYPIKAGETLDLATTPYGSGTIEYKENGEDFIFTNVHFQNDVIESCMQSIGFTIETWHNPHDTFNFEFFGENVWNNCYWEANNHQGGFNFFFHFAGESKIPTINFKGEGSLTLIGGTRAISGNVLLNIYNDINIVGLPRRLTKGIVVDGLTVKSGASISGSLGGEIIFVENDVTRKIYGDLLIEKGSRVNAIINPGKVSSGGTELYGIAAAGNIDILDADVSIEVYPDYEEFVSTNQPVRLKAMNSFNGKLTIKNSDVRIIMKALKVPAEGEVALFIDGADAIKGTMLDIINSNVDINMSSIASNMVHGLYSGSILIDKSKVNINLSACANVSGIVGYFDDRDFNGDVTIKNSELDINIYADTIFEALEGKSAYIDAGIRGYSIAFELDNDSYVAIETNEASPLVSTFSLGIDKAVPKDDYDPEHLILDDVNVSSDPYEINLDYYYVIDDEGTFKMKIETMFVPKDYEHHITKVLITAK